MRNRTWLLSILLGLAMIQLIQAADELPLQPVAHRGLLLHSPENTLANFTACQQLRLGFEFDVRRSKDGVLVCLHDDTLDRTTSGKDFVTAKTLAELKALDAGSWFDPAFRGEQIPTIDEVFRVIAAYPSKATLFTADLKGEDELLEQDIVQLADKQQVLQQILFIGRAIDHPEVRARLRKANPKCHVASLAQTAADVERAIADKNSNWVYLRFVPDAATIASIRQAGKQSIIAGVKVSGLEKENWSQSAAAGVNAVLTDYPLEFRTHVKQKLK
jgi:glycerophosphoryl diester phosphodiesterase